MNSIQTHQQHHKFKDPLKDILYESQIRIKLERHQKAPRALGRIQVRTGSVVQQIFKMETYQLYLEEEKNIESHQHPKENTL